MYYNVTEGLGLRKEAAAYATILNKLVQQAMRKGLVRNIGSNVKNIFTGGVRNVPGNVKKLFSTRPQYPAPKEMSAIRAAADDQYFGRYWDSLNKLYSNRAVRAERAASNMSRLKPMDEIKAFTKVKEARGKSALIDNFASWYGRNGRGPAKPVPVNKYGDYPRYRDEYERGILRGFRDEGTVGKMPGLNNQWIVPKLPR